MWIDFSSSNIENDKEGSEIKAKLFHFFIETRMLQSGALPLIRNNTIQLYADNILTFIKNK